jgi:hypothetical protein
MSLPQIMKAAQQAQLQLKSDGHNVEAEAVRRLSRGIGTLEKLNEVLQADLAHHRALLRRAHDAMTRGDPDGISEAEWAQWDQLVADIEKEIGNA